MDIEHEAMQQKRKHLFAREEDIRVTKGEQHEPWGLHVDVVVRLDTGISGAGAHKIRVGPNGEIVSDEIT